MKKKERPKKIQKKKKKKKRSVVGQCRSVFFFFFFFRLVGHAPDWCVRVSRRDHLQNGAVRSKSRAPFVFSFISSTIEELGAHSSAGFAFFCTLRSAACQNTKKKKRKEKRSKKKREISSRRRIRQNIELNRSQSVGLSRVSLYFPNGF